MRYFIVILLACLFGGCASVGHGIFMKRKYTRGHYWSLEAHKKNTVPSEHKTFEITPLKKEDKLYTCVNTNPPYKHELPKPLPIAILKHSNRLVSNFENSFTPIITNTHLQEKKQIRNKLQTYINKKNTSGALGTVKFVVYVILFFLLSFIYTLVIKSRNPSIPWLLCIVVAMLGSLLTLLTGQMFI